MATGKTITQRIALAGGAGIQAQLIAIGDSGKAAFGKLQAAADSETAFQKLGKSVVAVAAQMRNFADKAADAGKAGVKFGEDVGVALGKATLLTGGLAAAAGKVLSSFQNAGKVAEELQQNADAAALTTQEFQTLNNVLVQGGVSSESASKGLDKVAKFVKAADDETSAYNKQMKALRKEFVTGQIDYKEFAKRQIDINDNMGEAAKTAERYGIKLRDNNGALSNVRDVAIQFGEGLKTSTNKTLAAADALQVFGKGGRQIAQVFGQGRVELEKLTLEALKIAPPLSEGAKKALLDVDNAFDKTGVIASSLKDEIQGVFAPQVAAVVVSFNNVLGNNRERFIKLADAIRDAAQPAIDRLLAALDSPEIGTVIIDVINGIVDAAKAVGSAVTGFIIPAFLAIKAGADELANAINSAFGTQLTGGVLIAKVVIAKMIGLTAVLASGFGFVTSAVSAFIAAIPLLAAGLTALIPLLPALAIVALGVAIGVLIGLIIKNFPQILVVVKQVFSNIIGIFTQFPGNVANIWNAVIAAGAAAFSALGAVISAQVQRFIDSFKAFPGNLLAVWNAVKQGAVTAFTELVAFVVAIPQQIIDAITALPDVLAGVWAAIVTLAAAGWQTIVDGATKLATSIVESITGAIRNVMGAFTDFFSKLRSFWDGVIDKVKEYVNALAGASGGDTATTADAGATPKFAGGGHVRGPGSGTSDSILARISNGEFVTRAAAVRKYGLGIFQALNSLRLHPDALNGLSAGLTRVVGNISPAIPRFAAGGLVTAGAGGGGSSPLTIVMPGGERLTGMTASNNTVADLQRYATGRSISSAGRKPQWFRG